MMKAAAVRTSKPNESRAAANCISQKRSDPNGALRFAVNRPQPAAGRLVSVPNGPACSSKFIRPYAPSHISQAMAKSNFLESTQSMIIQRASITPASYFGTTRVDTDVPSSITSNELKGFGTKVKTVTWHTKLVFDALHTPGVKNGLAMKPEGSGVTGIIGPDHPFGSQPNSLTAAQNNTTAGNIRGMNPHGHVAAHIVNDQLGGPGITQNLFAFPGNANTLMETQVESKMKTAVNAGNYIYYRAKVHHPSQGPADYITMSWNKLDENGNDIGGGQANVDIRANNKYANTAAVPQGGGTEAKNQNLLHPSTTDVIKSTPWGPFQMPDPKNIVAIGPFLDISKFPAVGTKRAFEEFLRRYKGSSLNLQRMFSTLNNTAMTTNIGRWIQSRSTIQIKKRRGVTKSILQDLIIGTATKKENAFIDIMATGDADKVIPLAASEFAKIARSGARGRV